MDQVGCGGRCRPRLWRSWSRGAWKLTEVSDGPYAGAETSGQIIEVLDRRGPEHWRRLVGHAGTSEKGDRFVDCEPRDVNDAISTVCVECIRPRPGQGVGHGGA